MTRYTGKMDGRWTVGQTKRRRESDGETDRQEGMYIGKSRYVEREVT